MYKYIIFIYSCFKTLYLYRFTYVYIYIYIQLQLSLDIIIIYTVIYHLYILHIILTYIHIYLHLHLLYMLYIYIYIYILYIYIYILFSIDIINSITSFILPLKFFYQNNATSICNRIYAKWQQFPVNAFTVAHLVKTFNKYNYF